VVHYKHSSHNIGTPDLIQSRALPKKRAIGHLPPPTNVLSGDLSQTSPEIGFLQINALGAMAMGSAVLHLHEVDKSLKNQDPGKKGFHQPCSAGLDIVTLGKLLKDCILKQGIC
jgi:hypothetical protein